MVGWQVGACLASERGERSQEEDGQHMTCICGLDGFGWLRYLLCGSEDKTFPNINSKKTFQTFPKWCRSDWVLRCLEFDFRLANFETQNLNAWLSSCTAYVRPSFDVFVSCLSMARTVVRACVATRRDAVSRQTSFRRFQKQKCL